MHLPSAETAVDHAKLAQLLELVRPIPVFNGQNHRPGKGHYTAPKNESRATRKAKQDKKLVTLSFPKRTGNMRHPSPQWVAHTAGSGVLSGFASSSPNKAAHGMNGNIAFMSVAPRVNAQHSGIHSKQESIAARTWHCIRRFLDESTA